MGAIDPTFKTAFIAHIHYQMDTAANEEDAYIYANWSIKVMMMMHSPQGGDDNYIIVEITRAGGGQDKE